jgi:hypothetical protein
MFRWILALALAGVVVGCSSPKVTFGADTGNPDWQEVEAPPPPPVRTQGLIPLDVPGTALRFGVDPASIRVGADRVVRYVVVATSSSGTVNAMYEGIRCEGGDVKVYARHNPNSGWVPATKVEWQALQSTPNSRHSLYIARNGVCVGRGVNGNATQIVSDLRAPVANRFERGGVNR